MCTGLWSFTQTYKCKILTIVIFVTGDIIRSRFSYKYSALPHFKDAQKRITKERKKSEASHRKIIREEK